MSGLNLTDPRPYISSSNNPNGYSWAGRAWRNAAIALNNNRSAIAAIGAPIGGILIRLLDLGVNVNALRTTVTSDPNQPTTIGDQEQAELDNYTQIKLVPTIDFIIRPVNAAIASNNQINIIQKVNSAINQLATLILFAEKINLNGIAGKSNNYASNLSSVIVKLAQFAEQSLMVHVETNLLSFERSTQIIDVSNVGRVGSVITDFSGTTTIITVKKYIPKTTQATTQATTQTTTATPDPVITVIDETGEPKATNYLKTGLKIAVIITIAAAIKKALKKDNKKRQ